MYEHDLSYKGYEIHKLCRPEHCGDGNSCFISCFVRYA